MDDALATARKLAELSPKAFAQTKSQIRAEVRERVAANGQATDMAVADIWCADETLSHIRDYVARTLSKS
jgi:hypothetical protein